MHFKHGATNFVNTFVAVKHGAYEVAFEASGSFLTCFQFVQVAEKKWCLDINPSYHHMFSKSP